MRDLLFIIINIRIIQKQSDFKKVEIEEVRVNNWNISLIIDNNPDVNNYFKTHNEKVR